MEWRTLVRRTFGTNSRIPRQHLGAFSHSAGTARAQRQLLHCLCGNTPENHPPTEACMLNSKTVQLKRVVFSSSHLSKNKQNMYWNQCIWVPCVTEHDNHTPQKLATGGEK